MKKMLIIVLAVALVVLGSVAGAASIGVNMGSNEVSLATGDAAGVVVSQGNWNNASGGSGSLSNVKNNSGTTTTLDVSWGGTSPGTWHVSGNGTATGDAKMMNGYLDAAYLTRSVYVSLSEIPYAQYDVYVYVGGSNTGAKGKVNDGTTTYSLTNGSINPGGDGFQAADYVVTSDTGSAYPSANYAKFAGRTSSSVTVTIGNFVDLAGVDPSDEAMGIFGVQIVEIITGPGAATNPGPANGATNVAVTTDLSWTAGAGATSHNVYFGTVSPGTSRGNQTATTYDTGTMPNGTVHYWRIDEVNASGTTTGTVWSFTTVAAPSYKATIPSPSNGATSVAITADLSWTAGVLASSHDVYFGTSQAVVASASRLDGDIDGSGSVDIEDITVLAEQWLGVPTEPCADLDGDDDVNMVDFAIVSVDWLDSADAVYKGNQAGTSFEPGTLANSTTYYWRVDEVNCAESASPWAGDVWSFTTVAGGSAPGAASSPSPANGATAVSLTADLSWTAGSGATSHNVYFGTASPGTSRGNQAATTYDTGTMAVSTVYYWRIDEVNAYGTTTGTVWSFTTEAAASLVISNVSPASYTVQYNSLAVGQLVYIDRDYAFTNVASLGGSTYIKTANDDKSSTASSFLTFNINKDSTVYVAHDDGISPKPSWMSTFTDTGANFTHNGSISTFSVYSKDFSAGTVTLGGNSGNDISSMYSVVVVPRSEQACNPNPSDGATGVGINANLIWSAGAGATSRNVYFGTSSPGAFQGNQSTTTFEPGTLGANTTYYWRIDEIASGVTTTGQVWSFTTGSLIPGQAGNPSPVNGGTGVTVNIDLSWTAGVSASSHNVYFGTISPGTYIGNQTATTYDTGTMSNNKTYYWRIDEVNDFGTTTGTVWSFTTTPTGSMNYLNNGSVKIGVDSSRGATIIYFSQSGSSRNVINYSDLGREVQQSYYAGPIPFMGGYYNGQPWPWNPVEAGDTNNNRSTVLALANNGTTLYTNVIPKQWALNNVDSECTMEKWITLDGNTAHVHCRLILNRADTTQYADCDQELPAVYATNDLYRIFTYDGSSPFTGGALTQMPSSFPWSYTSITEHWIASVDGTDWGLGIFTPSSVWAVMGFYGTPDTTPPGSPTSSSTAYMAPIRREALAYNATYEYDFYLILDSLSNIRNYVYTH